MDSGQTPWACLHFLDLNCWCLLVLRDPRHQRCPAIVFFFQRLHPVLSLQQGLIGSVCLNMGLRTVKYWTLSIPSVAYC